MEVKFDIRDMAELQIVGAAMVALANYRTPTSAPQGLSVDEAEVVIASITPEGVTKKSEPATVSDADFVDAVLAYAKRVGAARAVELLAEFGAKRAPDVAPNRRAEFIARTEGVVA